MQGAKKIIGKQWNILAMTSGSQPSVWCQAMTSRCIIYASCWTPNNDPQVEYWFKRTIRHMKTSMQTAHVESTGYDQ